MLHSYLELLKTYGSDYQIQKALKEDAVFKLEKGVYSDHPRASELAILTCKYPDAIVTMNSAFYYHSLTDVIPDLYFFATKKNARGIRDPRVKQFFVPEEIFELGAEVMQRRDASFRVYSRERMLVELLRYKNSLPYDYYKEILGNYRNLIYELDIPKIEEYAESFPKSKMILSSLKTEVF